MAVTRSAVFKIFTTDAGAIAALKAVGDEGKKTAGTLENAFNKGTSKVGGFFKNLGNEMGNWGLPFSQSVSNIGTKLDEAETKGKKFESVMSDVGKITLGIGAAGLAAAAYEALKLGASFQQSMTQIETGAGESSKNMKLITNGVLSMAGSVGQGPQALAQGLYTIESAGYHGAKGLSVLKASAEGAAVGNAQMGTVADAVTSVMNAYGSSAGNATQIVNQLIATEKTGKSHMQDIAGALSAVIPIAANAGLSYAQVGGALSTMTGMGMSAQQATQDLANTIRALQNPNSTAVTEMEQLGLSSNDVAKNLGKRGLTGTLSLLTGTILKNMGPSGEVMLKAFNQSKAAGQDLQIMLQNMNPSMRNLANEFMSGKMTVTQFRKALPTNEQGVIAQFTSLYAKANGFNQQLKAGTPAAQTYEAALSKMTGGATGLNTALMLTGTHSATFAANVQTIGGAAASSSKNVTDFNLVQHTLAFQMSQAKAQLQALADRFGMWLIPKVEAAIGVVKSVVGWFDKNKWAAKALADVIGAVLGAAVATYALTLARSAAKQLQSFAKMMAGGAKWVASKLTGNAEVAASDEETAAVAEESGAATELAMGPIGIAIALVGLAAMLLASHWKTIWKDIKSIVHDAVSFITGHWKLLILALGPIGVAIDILSTHWKTIWHAIKTVTHVVWQFIDKNVFQPIKSVFKKDIIPALDSLKSTFKTVFDAVQKVVQDVWKVVKPIFDAFSKAIGAITGGISKIAKIGGGAIGSALKFIGIPHLASGGIVTSPTLALIGEAGPEAVVPLRGAKTSGVAPLSSGSGVGKTINVHYNPIVTISGTQEQIVHKVQQMITDSHEQLISRIEAAG